MDLAKHLDARFEYRLASRLNQFECGGGSPGYVSFEFRELGVYTTSSIDERLFGDF